MRPIFTSLFHCADGSNSAVHQPLSRHSRATITTLILMLTIGVGNAWGADVTFTAGTDVNSSRTITKSSVTLTLSSACPNLNGYSEYRIYSGASFTISCSAGISKIVITTNSDKGNATKLSATSGYSATGTTGTWTGDATSVQINADQGSQVRVTKIVVTTKSVSYTITATRNNDSYGTVEVSGTTITATPADCYQVVSGTGGYNVISGTTSSITHIDNSNTISVTPTSNCSIQVIFEKKVTNTYVDEIQGNEDIEECGTHSAPSLDDKDIASSGTCAQQHWHFAGWTTASYKASPEGHITEAGTSMTADGTTYYAVWSKGDANTFDGSTGGTFKIYANVSGTPYYMKNSISSNAVQTSTTKAQGQDWTFTKVTISSVDYWTISFVSSGTTYYLTGPSTNTADIPPIGTSAYNWKIAAGTYGTWRLWSASPNKSGNYVYAYRALMMNSSNNFKNYCPNDSYYDVEIGSAEYSDYICTCCEALASINGSVSWNSPTEAVVSWDNIAGVNSWEVAYKTGAGAYSTSNVSAQTVYTKTTTDDSRKVTITGLNCGTNYDFKITPTPEIGYCSADPKVVSSTSPKYGITLTSGGILTGGIFTADVDGSTDDEQACAGTTTTLEAAANNGYEFSNWAITGASPSLTPNATSSPATFSMPAANITVNAVFNCVTPTITTGPASANYTQDASATALSVSASAAGATLGYQWQSSSDNSNWDNIAAGDGGTAATYTPSTSSVGTMYYRVIVTNTATDCSTTATSGVATIGVSAPTVCLAPTLSVSEGTYTSAQSVELSCETDGATIYYTTDGSDPDEESDEYTEAIDVDVTTTIKAIAVKAGLVNSSVVSATYTIQCATPTFTPGEDVYTGSQTVNIATTYGDRIYYTTDGTTPNTSSTLYSSAITVSTSQTIKAIVVKDGCSNSAVGSAEYLIQCAAPTFSEKEGTYNVSKSVELATTYGTKIYYTTNGNTPSTSSELYSSAIAVDQSMTIKAISWKEGCENSDVSSATYTLKCEAPTFNISGGSYTGVQSVELSCTTDGATIYYTTDGSTPDEESDEYTEAIDVDVTTTIKAIAVKDGWTNSDVASASYTINYSVTWLNNGDNYSVGTPTTLVAYNSKVTTLPTAPSAPTQCTGKVFVGWTNSEIDGSTDSKPGVLFTTAAGSPAITGSTTFHAVWADEEEVETELELTNSEIESRYIPTGKSGATTSYGTFDITSTSGTWNGYMVIQLTSGEYNVQISKNASNRYLGSPTFLDNITKIIVTGRHNSASTRNIYLCSSNETPQPTSGDIGSGSIAGGPGDNAYTEWTEVEITPSGNYKQFYIYADGGLQIKSVALTTNRIDHSGYITACCKAAPVVGAATNDDVAATTATVICAAGATIGSKGCEIEDYGFVIGTTENPAIGGSGVTKYALDLNDFAASASFEKTIGGLTAGDTYYVRPYATNAIDTRYGTQTSFTTLAVASIAVKTTATQTAYVDGEAFNGTGLVITETYNNSTTRDVEYTGNEASFTFTPSTLTAGTTEMTITYSGKSTTQSGLTVYSVAGSIAIKDEDGTILSGEGKPTASRTGATLTTAAGAEKYVFKEWQISGASLGSVAASADNSIVDATGSVSLTAVYWKPRVVTWKNNNAVYTTTTVAYNSKPEFPSTPSSYDANSTTFVGWSTATWNGKIANLAGKTVYTNAEDMSAMTAETATYHAVFVKVTDTEWTIAGTDIDKVNNTDGYAGYNGTHTTSGVSFTTYQVMPNSGIQFQSKAGYLYNTTAISLPITRIVIESSSTNWTVYTGTESIEDSPASGAITPSTDESTHTFTVSAINHTYFRIEGGASTPKASSISAYYDVLSDYMTTKTYTITLDQGGEFGGTAELTDVLLGDNMPAATMPTNGRNRFNGYFDEEDGEGTQYYNADGTSAHVWDKNDDATLYASWSERYTVQFYAEDELTTIYRAADEKLNASVAGQGSAPADPSAPTLCSSKTFVGWSESAITLETDEEPDLSTTDSYVSADKTFYAVWATDNGDETYSAYSTYCYNAFVPDGGTGKGNWSDDENWSSGSAPDENTRVVIDSKEMTVDVTDAQAKEIVVKNEGKLIVAPGNAIIVAGKITKDNGDPTTAADLKVESSAAGNGTLIFENDGNAATVEMYSIGSTDGWKWQYIGVPFDGANAQATYYGAYLYKWDNGWTAVQKSDELEEFAGYCISYPATNYKYVMDGALAPTTGKDIAVSEGKSMVVGNSWTAPIQITQFEDEDFTGLLKNVYLYNTGNDESHSASTTSSPTGDAIYAAGTYISVPIHSAEYTGVKVISSLQGFFVKDDHNVAGGGTLKLNYSKHVRPSGGNSVVNGAMHAPKRVADETDRPAVLKMKVSGSQYDDRLILLEREDFTTGYDTGWDGDKMGDVATSPRITTTREDGTADAVAALPDLEGTLINFRAASTDDQYTLYFDYETEDAEPLYLLDLTNNAYTRVETGNSYTFFTTDKADHKRFALTHYRAPQITTGVEEAQGDSGQGKAVKFVENDKLYILRNGVLYDGTGKKVIEN